MSDLKWNSAGNVHSLTHSTIRISMHLTLVLKGMQHTLFLICAHLDLSGWRNQLIIKYKILLYKKSAILIFLKCRISMLSTKVFILWMFLWRHYLKHTKLMGPLFFLSDGTILIYIQKYNSKHNSYKTPLWNCQILKCRKQVIIVEIETGFK